MIKTSLIVAIYGTEHLFKRSLETYVNQTLPKDEWELIVVDDNAFGDVRSLIEPYKDKINIQYIRLEHPFGMRGNTISFNTAIQSMRGDVYCESTPEIMLIPEALELLTKPHFDSPNERLFVSLKTYNLTAPVQLKIDSVAWRDDINLIQNIEGFDNEWTLNNTKPQYDVFDGHQICSMKLKDFRVLNEGRLWVRFADYGSDDAWQCGTRRQIGWKNITEGRRDKFCFHQHHLPFNYFASKGHAPMLNKWNHTMSNYMNDKSGHVPSEGTSKIWDWDKENPFEQLSQLEKDEWKKHDDYFLMSGGNPLYLIPKK